MSDLMIPVSVGDHSMGAKSSAHTLVEYGDLQCPDTSITEQDLQTVLSERDGDLRLVYRHYPMAEMHIYAYQCAEATEAAGAQGKFWEMRKMILDNQEHLDRDSLNEYARELKLDVSRFERDLDSHAFSGKIDADLQSGVRSGVEGTPTFFLDGTMLDPSIEIYDVLAESDEDEDEDDEY